MKWRDVTVVIPTRNRCVDLLATLQTVVASDHPHLSIAVFDNCSDDGTADAVGSRFGDRVVLRRSKRPLAMRDSFEAAYEMVDTTWVLGLGADDGVHPSAISTLVDRAESSSVFAATALRSAYYWPSVLAEAPAGELRVPRPRDDQIVASERAVKDVLIGRRKWYDLPSGYFGLVRFEVLESIRKRNGRLFTSVTPDVGLNFAVAREVDRYIIVGRPLLIAGSSRRSNGMSQFGQGDPSIVRSFWTENARSGVELHPRIAAVDDRLPASMRVIGLEAYLQSGAPQDAYERILSTSLVQAWLESLTRPDLDDWWMKLVANATGTTMSAALWKAMRIASRVWRATSGVRWRLATHFARLPTRRNSPVARAAPKHAFRDRNVPSLHLAVKRLVEYLEGFENSAEA